MRSRRLLASQQPVERAVVEMLRGARLTTSGGRLPFLVVAAAQHGLTLRSPGALSIDGDEAVLLGWLAAAQRKTGEHMARVPRSLRPLILDCAAELDAQGLHLPYLAIQRLGFGSWPKADPPRAQLVALD